MTTSLMFRACCSKPIVPTAHRSFAEDRAGSSLPARPDRPSRGGADARGRRRRSCAMRPSSITNTRSASVTASATSCVTRIAVNRWSRQTRSEQPLHRDPGQRIERAERLVEREEARMADQRARQRHALLLAAGQHRRPMRRACSSSPTSRSVLSPARDRASGEPRSRPRPTSTFDSTRAQGSSRGSWNMTRTSRSGPLVDAFAEADCCRRWLLEAERSAAASVLLPQPLRPTMATNCPAGMCRSMPRSTWLLPNDLRKPRMVSGKPRDAARPSRRAPAAPVRRNRDDPAARRRG